MQDLLWEKMKELEYRVIRIEEKNRATTQAMLDLIKTLLEYTGEHTHETSPSDKN